MSGLPTDQAIKLRIIGIKKFIELQIDNATAGWHAFGGHRQNLDSFWNSTAAAESMAHNQWLYSPEGQ
jgi:hypothetical protein